MKGIYVFAPAGNAVRDVAYVKAGPFTQVDGFDWLCGWNRVITTPGVYDWTPVDSARAAADSWGKTSQLCMLPGFALPPYVLTRFPTMTIHQHQTGRDVIMCVPTDPGFLVELMSWIGAFGSHCSGDSDIASVQTTGLGDQGEMVYGELVSGTPVSYGITQSTLLAAWQQVVNAWERAFPRTQRSLAIGEPLGAHLPILPTLVPWLATNRPHMALQQNGLKATTPDGAGSLWSYLHGWHVAGRLAGWQMYGSGAANGDLATALNIGMAAGASYFQVYLADIVNPANTKVLERLAAYIATLP